MKSIFSTGLIASKLTALSIASVAIGTASVAVLSTCLIYECTKKPYAEKVEVDTLRGVVRRQGNLQERIDTANVVIRTLNYLCSKYVIDECEERTTDEELE